MPRIGAGFQGRFVDNTDPTDMYVGQIMRPDGANGAGSESDLEPVECFR